MENYRALCVKYFIVHKHVKNNANFMQENKQTNQNRHECCTHTHTHVCIRM